ncbi:MAG TPA: hypothetical protein VMB85_05090 [Bryobacteraceae bacterium]|nr:hypothetical protein [Bryobacteraceae bacterium]
MSHSDRYDSSVWFESAARAGVRFGILRVSFGRRIELARRIREIGRKAEYLDAASDVREKIEGAVLAAEIDRAYLEWGLIGVEGMEIDGVAATAASVIEAGPIELTAEILNKIKAGCGLTEDERKN